MEILQQRHYRCHWAAGRDSVHYELEMSTESVQRTTNWWGRASTISLFVWFLYWFKNEPHSVTGQILLWAPLVVIHLLAIQAARKRYGWIYLAPLGVFWIIVIIALSGGIPVS